jgi:hypothetical protein
MSTTEADLETLRYPIGRAAIQPRLSAGERRELIERMAQLPARLREAVRGMDDATLDTPYRPGGWTVRQVVHHLPDSHVNAYVRWKLAATESEPTIKPYAEAEWARLADSSGPIEVSLDLLAALHARWTGWMRTLDDTAWSRVFIHPESGRNSLEKALQVYAWHGEHHLAHVRGVRERAGRGAR